MSTALFVERTARALTLACLFLLPWQTRYIFWVPWIGTTESEFGVISVYVTMLLAGAAAAAWFLTEVLRGLYTKNQLAISGLVALSLVVSFAATYPSPAHAWILNVCFAFLLGYATYKTAHQNSRRVICVVLLGFIPVLVLGLWQMVTGWSPASSWFGLASRAAERLGDSIIMIGGQRILRMYGSFPHPNIFGAALALVFSAIATMSSRPPFAEGLEGGGIFKAKSQESRRSLTTFGMTYGLAPVLIIAVLFCISRSAALAMACALLASYGVSHKKKTLFVLACILPIFVWSLQFISPNLLALRGQSISEQQSISERVAQVDEWWEVMEQNGIWGTGVYQYPQALADLQGASLPAWAYQPVHNVFLLVIAELGIIGCGVLGVGFFVVGRSYEAMKLRRAKNGSLPTSQLPNSITSLLPLLITIYSLSWFDHVLWTSWSGMAYAAVAIALVFQGQESRISTLSQGVLDESR